MDLCQQSHVSAFRHTVWVCHRFPAKKQSSSDFMAAVTFRSDFGAQEEEICHYFHLSPFYLSCSNGAGCHDLSFFFNIYSYGGSFTLLLHPHKRLFSSSLLSSITVVPSAYLRLLMFLPSILIPACNSSSPVFLMMCSAYRLNKQSDSRQLCRTPFLILNKSVVPYRVLTVAS